jgi:DNA repair exonuclease SbcCD ATPase subunit
MNFRDDKGLILIVIGLLLSITIYGIFFGIPLIILGTYYLNKKVNQRENEITEELEAKKTELASIDSILEEKEREKVKEINEKLKDKKTELTYIDVKLEAMELQKEKEINEKLKDKKAELANIDNKLNEMERKKEKEINIKLKEKESRLLNLDSKLEEKKKGLIFVDDELEMQEVGLYQPKYDFLTAVLYKEKLDEIRKKQKDLIKNKIAAVCGTEWTVENSKQKGKAMTNANIKQILKTFNLECEMTISKVKLSNRESSVKRINKSFDNLNKLNERNVIKITPQYLDLKLQELDIAIEYELKKQEEKELLREAREQEKEERKIQKQLDAQEKKIKEQKMSLENDINTIGAELRESKSDKEKEKLELKIKELELALSKSNEDIDQIADRRTRTGAGYVYILSNIGSFGENVYKIGVTRRDEPQDRVRELSNASVPFKFDSHVFIFSKEAFELEKELHNRFDSKRVNKVNSRKEFFNITFDDVKKIVEENKDLVHSFNVKPEAQEYYDTLKIDKINNMSL